MNQLLDLNEKEEMMRARLALALECLLDEEEAGAADAQESRDGS